MVLGPNMQNFADITRSLSRRKARFKCRNPEELEGAIAGLLADENRRAELGRNAQRVIHENLGAIDRTVEMILEHLKKTRNLHRFRHIKLCGRNFSVAVAKKAFPHLTSSTSRTIF